MLEVRCHTALATKPGWAGPAWSKPELVVKYLIRMALLVFDTMIV